MGHSPCSWHFRCIDDRQFAVVEHHHIPGNRRGGRGVFRHRHACHDDGLAASNRERERRKGEITMAEQLLVALPEYWKSSVKPRNFNDFCEMIDTQGKITGIWEWRQWNPKTGKTVKREWNKNVVTDDGAIEIFKCAIANAVPAAVFNNIYINNNSGSSTLTTALTNGQKPLVSLAVAAIPAAIPLNNITPATGGTAIQVGYGTGQTQNVSMNGAAVKGATSLTTVSYTSNAAYAIGQNVVPLPNVCENPTNTNLQDTQTCTAVEKYSGNLPGGPFTYTTTTAAGNPTVIVHFPLSDATT